MGEVYQLEHHLAGGCQNTMGCKKVPEHIFKKNNNKTTTSLKKSTKVAYSMSRQMPQEYSDGDEMTNVLR